MNAYMKIKQNTKSINTKPQKTQLNRSNIILKTIQNNPGIHIKGLMDKTKLANGVITHYLTKLERQGVVKSQKQTKHRRYYPLDVTDSEYSIIRNLRKPTKKKIIFQILVEGNPDFKELTLKVKKSPGTISWNLSELIKEGVIEKCEKDNKQCYKIKDIKLLKHTFQKEFSKLLDEKFEHSEDIFLAL
jgi:predicted transcriptional regulator